MAPLPSIGHPTGCDGTRQQPATHRPATRFSTPAHAGRAERPPTGRPIRAGVHGRSCDGRPAGPAVAAKRRRSAGPADLNGIAGEGGGPPLQRVRLASSTVQLRRGGGGRRQCRPEARPSNAASRGEGDPRRSRRPLPWPLPGVSRRGPQPPGRTRWWRGPAFRGFPLVAVPHRPRPHAGSPHDTCRDFQDRIHQEPEQANPRQKLRVRTPASGGPGRPRTCDRRIMSPFPTVHSVRSRAVLAGQVGCVVQRLRSCRVE